MGVAHDDKIRSRLELQGALGTILREFFPSTCPATPSQFHHLFIESATLLSLLVLLHLGVGINKPKTKN